VVVVVVMADLDKLMKFKLFLFFCFIFLRFCVFSQNDLDAIRYSRNGVNGTSRFVDMGGAFGAIGADVTCAAYNPAGLAIFKKGDVSYSGSYRVTNNTATINTTPNSVINGNFAFNNFGFARAWKATRDNESRNCISFSSTQVQNFFSETKMLSYTNQNSIAKDMLNKATKAGNPNNLNEYYEGLGYNTYLLDYDGINFFSVLDIGRTVKQARKISTEGRVNDVNFSYAYACKDLYYFGLSIGRPRLDYTSTTTHTEVDDKDSMQITFTTPTTYTSNYIVAPPSLDTAYTQLKGFNSLSYTEYFKTTGKGLNIKIGGIFRVGESLRIGAYYHSPTWYVLKDEYYNELSTTWDANKANLITERAPQNGGTFNYKITTPSKVSLNAAYVIKN
jgi:hypothetical protein